MDPTQGFADFEDQVSDLFLVEGLQVFLSKLLQGAKTDTINNILGDEEMVVISEDFLHREQVLVQEASSTIETKEVGFFALSAT